MVLHRRSHGVALPELPLETWQASKDTLQLYTQIIGKLRLALSPPEPEWAHVVLYVTSRGLTTGPIPYRDRTFQVDFDFIAHKLIINASDGTSESIGLGPRRVADFYADVFALLEELDIIVDINPIPQELPNPISFEKDTLHAAYDADAVHRFWQALTFADTVLKIHRAPFFGRHSLVHFFWGGFDLAYTRYSGKPATPPPGANKMMRLSMDVEEVYTGFWMGDARYPAPAFASYVYPKPPKLETFGVRPSAAAWNEQVGLFILPYDAVRTADDPTAALLEFFASTYQVCSECSGWDASLLPKNG